jgi:hypothetical protein
MKVLKKGKVKPRWMYASCGECGCRIRCDFSEVEPEEDRNETYYRIKGPTKGCNSCIRGLYADFPKDIEE